MNKTVKGLLWAGAGMAAVAAANNAIFARAKALGNTLGGEGRFWPGPYGDLFYARQGKGRPVVLIHGIYAGASSYEWRKNFDALSEHFQVYALDWLGFGLSDKPRIRYSAAQYIEQLAQFLRIVVAKDGPCAVVASSLGAAYAIQVAANAPDLIDSLVLVCPTGMGHLSASPNAKTEVLYQTLHSPLLGTTLYTGLTSLPSLRTYLMNQSYFDPSYVDEALLDHYSTATHQYGAQNAPPSFISGLLNHSVAEAFPALTQKEIRLVWGREARMTPLADAEPFLAANARAELTVLDKAGLLPQDEQAQAFIRLCVEVLTEKKTRVPRSRTKKASEETNTEAEGGE